MGFGDLVIDSQVESAIEHMKQDKFVGEEKFKQYMQLLIVASDRQDKKFEDMLLEEQEKLNGFWNGISQQSCDDNN
jgi:Holliday junction resolvasome RuvABC ATP-dependent DNA helicase subunit